MVRDGGGIEPFRKTFRASTAHNWGVRGNNVPRVWAAVDEEWLLANRSEPPPTLMASHYTPQDSTYGTVQWAIAQIPPIAAIMIWRAEIPPIAMPITDLLTASAFFKRGVSLSDFPNFSHFRKAFRSALNELR